MNMNKETYGGGQTLKVFDAFREALVMKGEEVQVLQ